MTRERCPCEDELLDALARGFVSEDLKDHLPSCAACAELQLVAGALLDDRAQSMLAAPIPSAGTMWFRLRLRERRAAEATARRSLLIGQTATLAVAVVLLVVLFRGSIASGVHGVISTIRLSTPLLLAVGTWILAAPIAGWVAIRQK